jgi:hypothetical protein
VDRYSVGSVAELELEGERQAAKDLEWAGIGRGKGGGWAGGARTKTIGAERSSGGRSGGGSVAGGWDREPEREDFKFRKK